MHEACRNLQGIRCRRVMNACWAKQLDKSSCWLKEAHFLTGLCLQSLAAMSKANTADVQPLMSKLDTLLRSLLADFSSDNAGRCPCLLCWYSSPYA